jgi:hypothetical protein
MAGYSTKPLIEKLGIKAGMTALFIDAPADYFDELGSLSGVTAVQNPPADFIHVFTMDCDQLSTIASSFQEWLNPGGILWVSWPKKSSGRKANINEQDLRDIILPTGLVDVKVAAVTEVWSGIKFLRRRIT